MAALILDGFAVALGLALAIVAFHRLPLTAVLRRLAITLRKSLSVTTSSRISDHWKERVVPVYALTIFRDSLVLALQVFCLAAIFVVIFVMACWPFVASVDEAFGRLWRWQPQAMALVFGIGYWLWQRRPGNAAYNGAERLLHRLALGSPAVPRLAFDIDCLLAPVRSGNGPSPVYVAGLARSGTTILLEALNASGAFTSLTYRHMPFVTAPYLWTRLSASSRQEVPLRERAHGDGIQVGADSVEAFEEVFWLACNRDDYVTDHGLLPHRPDSSVVEDYRRYVGNILAAAGDGAPERYLSKGNNNLLRIGALQRAFPDAVILVPFRSPVAHARSLLAQHRRFLDIHGRDAFSLRYMNWLGHFEFGANLKPFLFPEVVRPATVDETLSARWWLDYWSVVYEYLLDNHSTDVRFFDYERMTEDPQGILGHLGDELGLERGSLQAFAARIRSATRHPEEGPGQPPDIGRAAGIFERLKAAAGPT